ncbi:hypothetical protein INR49_019975 [Caranx melampygus]|nr:hypothetical protein INR49_019975 [Caranx melampygus]
MELLTTELPQQHACQQEEEEEQQEPEPPQIKEEEEEVCSSQEGEQLLLKQETDSLMLTPTHEGSEHREPEPTSEQQLLSHSSTSDTQTGKKSLQSHT